MSTFSVLDLLPPDHVARAYADTESAARGAPLLDVAQVAAARELDRDALVTPLVDRLRALKAPEAALASLERLRSPGVVAVVAGQQPGLLGGPLMILVKALAAAAVARDLSARGVPAVALFWHASEDHDLAEADHVGWPTADGVDTWRAPFDASPRMLSMAPLPPRATECVARALGALPAGAGFDTLRRVLPVRDETFGTWTARLLARVLGAHGIALVEPHSLRGAALGVARTELLQPGALYRDIRAAEVELSAGGFASPLSLVRPGLLFDVDPVTGERRRTQIRDGVVEVAGTPRGTTADVLAAIERDPGRVSWNVVSRVLAQNLALPVAAQICGPAEFGYVSLLARAHARMGLRQPATLLRPGVTLVDRATRRACSALGVLPVDVLRRGDDALPWPPAPGSDAFGALSKALDALPSGSSPAAQRRRREVHRNAALLRAALEREARERDTVAGRRRRVISGRLRPSGGPMERVVSFLPWFARHGDGFAAHVIDALGTGDALHHVLSDEALD